MSDSRGTLDTIIVVRGPSSVREVALGSYLDEADEERSIAESNRWIKSLRRARVDGMPFRSRFTYRGDSLWWFTELYFHKQQVVLGIFRTALAVGALLERESPSSVELRDKDVLVGPILAQLAAARGVACSTSGAERAAHLRRAALDARARWLHLSARAARRRFGAHAPGAGRPDVLAFVHRAFWPAGAVDGSADSYVGPVLESLEGRIGRERVRYVSVGPSSNFSARRWWHGVRGGQAGIAAPVETFAPPERLAGSEEVWRTRQASRRALWKSTDLRSASLIRGVDCWPVIREELAGVALLQWPWSARAMDEAGAALDVLQPRASLTYAESGGWGRAIVLECRRRGVPIAGLQHGFIYRHWLNYLHEADEMEPDPDNAADPGFPCPTVTLLFDDYAAMHLAGPGHYPRHTLRVTGSPRLDVLMASAARVSDAEIASVRAAAGAPEGDLVLVATKYREARRALPRLIDAAARLPDAHLVIKAHPAETPDVYSAATAGHRHVSVLAASTPLAPLLKAARAVVTVNSTVALDAAVLDVPALVIGLPNNLTPFVDAGVLAGAPVDRIEPMLRQILYDCAFREALQNTRREFVARYAVGSPGNAARRTADAVVELTRREPGLSERS